METISTRRHLFKFYFILLFFTAFTLCLGSLILLESIELYKTDQLTRKKGFQALFAVILYGVAISLPYSYWKNSPKITVDELSIRFGTQTFHLNDIIHFDLTAKVPFHYIISVPMEGSTITFRDGTVKTFIDDMYANSWEIKSFLHRCINKVEYIFQPITRFEQSLIDSERKDVFKGNQFTTISAIALWGGLVAFIMAYLDGNFQNSIGMLLVLLTILTIWFLFHSWFMNYFCLTKNILLVKNHNLLWRKNYYRLSDIEEVVIEMPDKHPYCMRIITKNFKSKLYPAATLRTRTWHRLIEELEAKGVSVRDECIRGSNTKST